MNEFEKKLKPVFLKLKNFIFSKIEDKEEAEEIFQETLISANESFFSFRGKSSFYTWICGIAKHEIADFYRKKKIKKILFSSFPILERIAKEALIVDDDWERQEIRNEVRKILRTLNEGYREILRLKYYKGLSMKEIAEKLRISVKAVESRLSRAREMFRKNWEFLRTK